MRFMKERMGCWWALEMAEAKEAGGLEGFTRALSRAEWSVKGCFGWYRRGRLRLELDAEAEPAAGDALTADDALQSSSGRLRLDGVEVRADKTPLVLLRRGQGRYVLMNPATDGVRLEIRAAGGTARWDRFPRCRMEMEVSGKKLRCRFDCLDAPPKPDVLDGLQAIVRKTPMPTDGRRHRNLTGE